MIMLFSCFVWNLKFVFESVNSVFDNVIFFITTVLSAREMRKSGKMREISKDTF